MAAAQSNEHRSRSAARLAQNERSKTWKFRRFSAGVFFVIFFGVSKKQRSLESLQKARNHGNVKPCREGLVNAVGKFSCLKFRVGSYGRPAEAVPPVMWSR